MTLVVGGVCPSAPIHYWALELSCLSTSHQLVSDHVEDSLYFTGGSINAQRQVCGVVLDVLAPEACFIFPRVVGVVLVAWRVELSG